MDEFPEELRHYCRNPRCRSKLPQPIGNPREAFCARGCYSGFYRSRCVVCEQAMERVSEGQRICGRRKCRNAIRRGQLMGRFYVPGGVGDPFKTPIKQGPFKPDPGERARLIRKAKETEFIAGRKWQEVVSPDGVKCYVAQIGN